MTIRRDDLMAAAAAGLLQYRQVDPLLVFLLQRDIAAKRQTMLAQARPQPRNGVHALLSFLLGLVVLVTAVMFGVLFASRAAYAMSGDAFVLFALLYLAAGIAMANLLRRGGYRSRVRLLFAMAMASVPLAVVAVQQLHTG